LYITSFVAGFITLSLEMLGFRMLAPYFGYSIYISGSLIGIILISLTLGYYLGGILADKKPDVDFMFKLILISDIYIFLIALTYNKILAYFSNFDLLLGTALSTLVIFALPMILLSTVSPYLVKTLSSKNTVGKVSGNISALSTLGNIAGVFVTTFLLIPEIGTHKTIYILAVSLLIISVYWLAKINKKYLFSILILLLINTNTKIDSKLGNVIYSEESEYNLVRVIERDRELIMVLNSDKWGQSITNKDSILSYRYYDYFNLAPLISEGENALVLGMGSGVSVVQFRNFFPNLSIDAVEIDPRVVETSYNFFNLPKNDDKLNVYIEDAKSFLKTTSKKYDVIEVDMYNGDIYVPFYLVTEEFFKEINNHLKDNGVLIMNVAAIEESENKYSVFNPISNTIASVFPSAFAIRIPHNVIVIATKTHTSKEEIMNKIKLGKNNVKELGTVTSTAMNNLEEIKPDNNKIILTDDKSPIEKYTYEMQKGIN